MAFAKEIGWLQSDKEIHDVKEEYQRVLAYQQSSEDAANAAGMGNGFASGEGSGKNPYTSNPSTSSSSSPKKPTKESNKSPTYNSSTNASGTTTNLLTANNGSGKLPSKVRMHYE